MIKYVTGDATSPVGDGHKFIVHVCNDIGLWGKGFVLALSKKWNLPERRYQAWHSAWTNYKNGFPFELGYTQFVPVEEDITVVNMIAQYGVRTINNLKPHRQRIHCWATEACLMTIARASRDNNASIHMPRIGCGLGGAKWSEIELILKKIQDCFKVDIVVYDLP